MELEAVGEEKTHLSCKVEMQPRIWWDKDLQTLQRGLSCPGAGWGTGAHPGGTAGMRPAASGKQLSIMDEFRVIFLELALMGQGLASSLSAGP